MGEVAHGRAGAPQEEKGAPGRDGQTLNEQSSGGAVAAQHQAQSATHTRNERTGKDGDEAGSPPLSNLKPGGEDVTTEGASEVQTSASEAPHKPADVNGDTSKTSVTTAAASAAENVKDTKNADSSVSPVWVHGSLLMLMTVSMAVMAVW
ncbi:hypothetical protein DQ04_22261000 [Trypanosoma grayi]|uniref:hypothetical protein n=1 Tax=Trypanosoma grayi TaxID=71804 RepID=UPI0004F4AA6D|nr:hypothetical protein DQ04_22261000 [Trypanosoma grayi]KEG05412.1 hypothetical protein DQ04_22261000 [Trypanosoma grayi]